MKKNNPAFIAVYNITLIVIIIMNCIITTSSLSQPQQTYDSKTKTIRPGSTHTQQFYNKSTPPQIFNWQMVETPTFQGISNIFFIDSLNGWATHFEGVMRSTDGGYSWVNTNFGNGAQIDGLHFINRDTGLIVGTCSTIKRTTNGGISWSVIEIPFTCDELYDIRYFNNNNCVLIGERDNNYLVVYRSTNGGVNWVRIFLGNTPETGVFSSYWFNESTGWICGRKTLLKTTDGGYSYANFFPNVPPTSNGYNALLGISFVNENTGWLSGSNVDNKNMHQTTNGGNTWLFQDNPVAQFQFPQLEDVLFINQNTGWAVSYVGQIIATINGGANWLTDVSAPTWFYCLSDYNHRKLWCGAEYGEIWYLNELSPIGIQQSSSETPKKFSLEQNYPNPFNSQTIIKFNVAKRENVKISIYDLLGQTVEILAEKTFNPGTYTINYNAGKLTSGVYIYVMETELYKESKKFVLIK